MKRGIIKIASISVVFALVISILLGTLVIYANSNIDYELDEKMFSSAKESNTTTYLAYNKNGDLKEVFKSSSGGARSWVSLNDMPKTLAL